MYAHVVIEYPVKSLDKLFTYVIPSDIKDALKIGMKVLIPFGSKPVNGFVLKITDEVTCDYELKEIIKIVDENLVLTDELLKLGKFMVDKTLATRISCYQAMLPSGLKAKNKKTNYDIFDTFIMFNKDISEVQSYLETITRSKKKTEIVNRIINEKEVNKKEISSQIYKELINTDLFKEEKRRVYRLKTESISETVYELTNLQKSVYTSVKLNEASTYLLYGVTGSGKTEVYLKIIEDAIKMGKTALLLAPEISLTMQLVKRFYARFGNSVAVFHSALSDGEKYDEYLKIINKKVNVVVGTRSAVFAPLTNLGVIIIDEEHSDTYKQDNNPRYHAKDAAIFRSEYNNCPLILGSATPSFESYARAKKGVYKLLTLDKRVNDKKMPTVEIIDMNEEVKKKNFIFSEALVNEINNVINKDEQVILLLNRRGFSTFITCASCGFTYKCPECDITLTYHKSTNNLRCHYCGYTVKKSLYCPECSEESLNYLGLGTEQIEEYINENIPGAKVIRMDQDTTRKKGSHDKIIESFKNKEYNILLGTQMISKGLDFKCVTLVGVINADTTLNLPDYKSGENTYSLLSQVAGRSGRSDKNGKVLLQTFNPDNFVLKCVEENNYEKFYQFDMLFRKNLLYPPYVYLASIKVVSKEYELSLKEATKIVSHLKSNLDNTHTVLGPTTCALFKYKNNYRFQIVVKYKKSDELFKILKNLENYYATNYKVNIELDFNPSKI